MVLRPKVILTRRLPQPGIDLLESYIDLSISSLHAPMSKHDIIAEIFYKYGVIGQYSILKSSVSLKNAIKNAPKLLEDLACSIGKNFEIVSPYVY